MFLKPKDLENMRVNGLISRLANPKSGIIPYTQLKKKKNSEKIQWNYSVEYTCGCIKKFPDWTYRLECIYLI
jgi:hypothetical protein